MLQMFPKGVYSLCVGTSSRQENVNYAIYARPRMPIITIQTNVSACQVGASFHKDITEIASEFLQKSQKIIWVMLETEKQLTMGTTKEPTAIVSVECIGRLKPKLNLQFGTKLEEYLLQNLGIPKNRVVIKFVRVPALFCQFDGHLHDTGIEFDEDIKS